MTVENISPRTELLEKCPVCESKNTKLYFTAPDRLHGVAGEFSYHLCGGCQTVFQNPMVIQEDLHLCYPSEYTPYNHDPEMPELSFKSNGNNGFLKNSRNLIREAIVKEVWNEPMSGVAGLTGKVLSKSRVARERAFYGIVHDECIPHERGKYFALDVGCGAGWMLKRLKQVGWQVEGIEWDKKAAEVASERTGEKVWAGDFREIELPKEKYGLIHLSHVFEHFHDPLSLLKRFYELLSPKGKLVLIYPNPHSFDSEWYKDFWYAWDPPRHLVFPTPESFKDYAYQIGFKDFKVNSIVAKHCWSNSKAYQMGLHPDKTQPELGFKENLGLWYQRLITKFGMNKGSEVIVVLEKP